MVRRWWLVALAVGSLVVLLYASIATALSVPLTEDVARANQAPGGPPLAGVRALVVPIPDPTRTEGTLVVGGDSPSGFPSGAQNVTMGRVLAYVAPTANGSYVPDVLAFDNVTFVENGTLAHGNLSVDVASLAGGRTGYVLKGDASRDVVFVEEAKALGSVARFVTPLSLLAMFSFGSVGFIAPLLGLILTQRRKGVPGIPVEVGGCPECRAPVEKGADFCLRCGAWLPKPPGGVEARAKP